MARKIIRPEHEMYKFYKHFMRRVNEVDPDYRVPPAKVITIWDIMTVPPRFFYKIPQWMPRFMNLHWCVYWEDERVVGIEDEPHMLLNWCREEERLHKLGIFDDILCTEVFIGNATVQIIQEHWLTFDDIKRHRIEMTNKRCEWFILQIISNWEAWGSKKLGILSQQYFLRLRHKLRKKARYQKYKDLIGLKTTDLVQLAAQEYPNDAKMHPRGIRPAYCTYDLRKGKTVKW